MKIDKDIPLPKKKGGRERADYPFKDLEVGHSFFRPGVKVSGIQSAIRAAKARGEIPKEWTFLKEVREEDGVEGCRVWRQS